MSSTERYTLEYWIDSSKNSKEQLESHVKRSLSRYLGDINLEVQEKDKYLILHIVSTEKIIDSCHDKLDFDRESSFRAKDELGDSLRSQAYPILAEIELSLRRFIQQAMINVLGFNWWNSFISENIQGKVKTIEAKAGKNQVKSHHPIEFTFFEDLLVIVTTKFQAWSSNHTVTVGDIYELLTVCDSVDKIQQEIDNRTKIVSFWDDVFSDYFDDKRDWIQLKEDIEELGISLRNKVMHHRLIRCHELQKLKCLRDKVKQVISLSKTTLSEEEIEKIKPSVKIITDKVRPQFDAELIEKSRSILNIDPAQVARVIKSTFDPNGELIFNLDPAQVARAIKSTFDPNGEPIFNVDPELYNSQEDLDDPEKQIEADNETSTPASRSDSQREEDESD